MNLLPFENFDLKSPLKKRDVELAVKNNISWKTNLGLTFNKNSIYDYEGFVDRDKGTFTIRRILKSGRNSFIPVAKGTITEEEGGYTQVNIKLRLHKFVMAFAVSMTVFLLILFVLPLFQAPIDVINKDYLIEELSMDKELADDIISRMDKSKTNEIPTFDWHKLLLLFFPYLLCTVFFNFESIMIKNKLESILRTYDN